MSSFLAKRLSNLFSPSSFHRRHLLLLPPLLRLSFSTQPSEQKNIPYLISSFGFSPDRALRCSTSPPLTSLKSSDAPFIAQYLISSFDFSPERALKVTTDSHLAAIKSEDRPNSVVIFLKETGLSDDQIKAVVSLHPGLLASNVERTLKPKVRELKDGDFNGELLVQLIRYNPAALLLKNTLSSLLFWRDFVGNNDQTLLTILQRNGLLIQYNLEKYVIPRINLFKEYGLSNQDIVGVLGIGYSMSRNLDSLRQTLEFIAELGIPRESSMFIYGFKALCGYTKNKLKTKVEFLKMMCGWSQEELCSAFTKAPRVLAFSENKIKLNMDFLIREAKLEPGSIASQPLLLTYSLEKRLVPRYHVLSILAAKGLKKRCSLSTACGLSEKRFLEKYLEPYKKEAPELVEAYFAASSQD